MTISYNQSTNFNETDELPLTPLRLESRYLSPEECTSRTFSPTPQYCMLSNGYPHICENEVVDDISSPVTESILLSPVLGYDRARNKYENTSGEEEEIEEDTFSYGRRLHLH